MTCLKHSNFFTVKCLLPAPTQWRPNAVRRRKTAPSPAETKAENDLKFNYKLFNCNNFNIRYWSWNYRGCWHQTCPPIVPR